MRHEFVELIPENIEEGVIYVSVKYSTAVHRCCCGCRKEVVTPLSPTDWRVIYDGETISLYPSIGNWAFECKSHYWIENNEVIWAEAWSEEEIESNKSLDKKNKQRYYDNRANRSGRDSKSRPEKQTRTTQRGRDWSWEAFKKKFR